MEISIVNMHLYFQRRPHGISWIVHILSGSVS